MVRQRGCRPDICGVRFGHELSGPQCACAVSTVVEIQMSPAGPVLENQTVTLTCNTPREAAKQLHYSWYKNQVLLGGAQSSTLRLRSVTRADSGFYYCVVENIQGSQRSDAVSVEVRRKWPGLGALGTAGAGDQTQDLWHPSYILYHSTFSLAPAAYS